MRANQVGHDHILRSNQWLDLLPHGSSATAWGERLGKKGYNPGAIWDAVQEIRGVDTELSSLAVFSSCGWNLILPKQRGEGMPDWVVEKAGQQLHIEVKSKGGAKDGLDVLHSAVEGIQLLDPTGELRRWQWDINSRSICNAIGRFTRQRRLDPLLSILFAHYGSIAKWLASGTEEDLLLPPHDGVRVDCTRHGWLHCGVDVHSWSVCAEQWEASFEVMLERTEAPWFIPSLRAEAEWLPEGLPEEGRAMVGSLLTKLLLGQGDKRGKQLSSFPENTTFIVHWRAPWQWDGALAANPDEVAQLLSELSEAARAYQNEPAIGLWADSFSQVAGRIHFNDAAQCLVGASFLDAPWRRSGGASMA